MIEEYTLGDCTIQIDYDQYYEDVTETEPVADRLGKVHFALYKSGSDLPWEIKADTADYKSYSELAKAVTAKNGELPGLTYKFVRWYEHSGISLSLRDDENSHDWDAGIAGVIFGDNTEDIEGYFNDWACYITGEVYESTVTDTVTGELIDSGGGFHSYDEAKSAAEGTASQYVANITVHAHKAQELHR